MGESKVESYRVLLRGGEGEIVEKKSRFIATIQEVQDETEAVAFLEKVKKKYWDARHNCSAFVIGRRAELTRCSDDGEPSGTAGRPMLEVLLGSEIRNIAVVVTRYFGGTLLGTGGLVRAYTQAVQEGLKQCQIGWMQYGYEIELQTDYNSVGKIQHLLRQREIVPMDSSYTDSVTYQIRIPQKDSEGLQKELMEATGGKVIWTNKRELYYLIE